MSLLACCLFVALLTGEVHAAGGGGKAPESQRVIEWLRGQRDVFARDLEAAHGALMERAEREGSGLVEKLKDEKPVKLRTGYGLLPELRADSPAAPVTPRERTYSLEVLSTGFAREIRDAALLVPATADGGADLGRLVNRCLELRGRLTDLDEHIAYHAQWQVSVREQTGYFAGRNELVARARTLQSLRAAKGPPAQIAELYSALRGEIAPFVPTGGLRIERAPDGSMKLPVTVWTDIADERFLASFESAVLERWSRSEASRRARFEVALEIRRVTPADLQLERFPEVGEAIDVKAHAARFPREVLVLTSGAQSTHAMTGRSILLGPARTSPRTLAHEFGHLLGFTDGYLRGYDGDPAGTFGATMVEWTGLFDDLMGNTYSGEMTDELINQLISAYSAK